IAAVAVARVMVGGHPGFYNRYTRPGNRFDRRHAREYTPQEISQLLNDAGFEVFHIETGPYGRETTEFKWAEKILERQNLATQLRGDCIYALGRKADAPATRFPSWLYDD